MHRVDTERKPIREIRGAKASPIGRSNQAMSGANASPIGRSNQAMSGANASTIGRSNQAMSGANASPIGRSNQAMSGANASPIGRSNQAMSRAAVHAIARVVLVMVFDLSVLSCRPSPPAEEPMIEFTRLPPAGEGSPSRTEAIEGRVTGAQSGQRIVLFARSGTWWVQPFEAHPFTEIRADSTW